MLYTITCLILLASVAFIINRYSRGLIRFISLLVATVLILFLAQYLNQPQDNILLNLEEISLPKLTLMNSILAIAILIVIVYLLNSIKIINQGNEALVERLGRYHRKLEPGFNFIIPLLDSIVLEESVRERVLETSPQEAFTKDNVYIETDAVIYWRILQLERTYYAVEDVEEALQNLVITTLRSKLGQMQLEQAFSSRSEINHALLQQLDDATATWGVKVTRVEAQRIVPSPEVVDAMTTERTAESNKRAAISEAEGKKRAEIEEAEGVTQAVKLLKEAMQDVSSETILQYLLARKYIDANYQLSKSDNAKIIFIDPKFTESMGSLMSFEELKLKNDVSDAESDSTI